MYRFLERNFENHVVPYVIVNSHDLTYDYLFNLGEEFKNKVTIEGLVISDFDVPYNFDTACFGYNQIAFKFQDEVKISKIKHIEWTMSKHGAYIPVVVIEPIELEGTTVQRITGYNAKWVRDMKIESGKYVAVRKSNMIIPQIMEVIE